MGLLFSLQPDIRKSTSKRLFLQSAKRKFFMGGVLFFGACVLGTMYLAAIPIFEALWNDGGFWDKAIAGFFRFSVVAYPAFAASCFLYFDNAILETTDGTTYNLKAYKSLLGIRFHQRTAQGFPIDQLKIHNWKGALNTASLEAQKAGKEDRYATKGHWILSAPDSKTGSLIDIEKRAKKEEIYWLKSQIELYFSEDIKNFIH